MTGRRKGTPCACETDPCSCGSSKGKCIKAINNVSPDPNGDFNLRAGPGISIIQSGDDEITVINSANPISFIAGSNIELNPSGDEVSIDLTAEPVVDGLTVNGDTQLNGDLEVNGDIIQNGAAYETHAQHIYTVDDYIIMRDGAISALAAGDYSGFQVKKYDGTNDGRLVIDNAGVARVGDVGDEQPLLTRSEAANLTDGQLLKWDAANSKAIGQSLATYPDQNSAAPITSAGVYNAIKAEEITNQVTISSSDITGVRVYKSGKVVTISIIGGSAPNNRAGSIVITGLPPAIGAQATHIGQYDGVHVGMIMVDTLGQCQLWSTANTSGAIYESLTYICQ